MTAARRRFNDADEDDEHTVPIDDAVVFCVTGRQAAIHSRKETRRQMEKVAAMIWGSLATYAATLKYVSMPSRWS